MPPKNDYFNWTLSCARISFIIFSSSLSKGASACTLFTWTNIGLFYNDVSIEVRMSQWRTCIKVYDVECTVVIFYFFIFFQASGMELNLSKNVISCGDSGTHVSLLLSDFGNNLLVKRGLLCTHKDLLKTKWMHCQWTSRL